MTSAISWGTCFRDDPQPGLHSGDRETTHLVVPPKQALDSTIFNNDRPYPNEIPSVHARVLTTRDPKSRRPLVQPMEALPELREWSQSSRLAKAEGPEIEKRSLELKHQWKQLVQVVVDRCASDNGALLEALDSLWNDFSEAGRTIEARYAVALRSVPRKEYTLSDQWKQWFEAQIDSQTILPEIDVLTRKALAAVVASVGISEGNIEIIPTSNGRIILEFSLQHGVVQWLVNPTSLPWPGIDILATRRDGYGASSRTTICTYHRISQALDGIRALSAD